MSNEKLIKIFMAGAIIFSGNLVYQNVLAKSGYHWVKATNYLPHAYHAKVIGQKANVWNWNHTKVLHNMKNYPHTTWYANRTVTMHSGSKRAVYYQVTSGNKKNSGYIWRGYLTKGKYKSVTNSINNDSNKRTAISNGKSTYLTDPYRPTERMSTVYVNDSLNNQIASLFLGTEHTIAAQNAANLFYLAYTSPNGGDYQQGYLDYFLGEKTGEQTMTFSTLGNPRYAGSSKGLVAYITQKLAGRLKRDGHTFNDFAGYQIGVYVFPKNTKWYGNTMVYLVPGN
ncbi:hypothetical protein [Levilactobacillus brevis]|uniref:hypothetical protein n=1 Tax=Levilactobacillus brevis TaxID=1580 RepID=UPI000A2057C6|nr:hypothetical protein [Levilactobacillus brevis]ARN93686.1 hypothetical protein AZI11_12690 [Levilactobacillus brevis]